MSTEYNVKTVYSAEDRSSGVLARLVRAFQAVSGVIRGVLAQIFSLRTAIAAVFSLAGLARAASSVMRVGGAAEEAQIALAGMMQAGGAASDITQGMGMASRVVEQMREDARNLPGEFQDVMNIFRGGLTPSLNAGQSVESVRRVSGQLMAVTQMLGIDSEQAGRDFALMMEGRAGAQVATFSRLRGQIGMTAEQFNQLAPAERFRRIEQSLRGFGPAVERYSKSWAAVSSTSRDHLGSIWRVGTAPLFDRVRDTLFQMNGLFERNQTRVLALASSVGGTLARGFDNAVNAALRLGDAVDRIRSSAIGRGVGGLLNGARGLLGTQEGQRRAAVGVASVVGLSAGIPGLGLLVSGLIALSTHTAAVTAIFAQLQGIGSALWSVLGPAVTMLDQLAQFVGDLLAAVLPGIIEGIRHVIDGVAPIITTIIAGISGLIELIRPQLLSIASTLGGAVASLGAALAGLAPIVQWLAQGAFAVLGWVLTNIILPPLQWLASVIRTLSDVILWLVNQIPSWMRPTQTRVEGGIRAAPGLAVPEAATTAAIATPAIQAVPAANAALDEALRRAGRVRGARGNTNVRQTVNVHQTIERADDPDRVLRATRTAVLDALMHPLESTGVVVER